MREHLTAVIGANYQPFTTALDQVKRQAQSFVGSVASTMKMAAGGFALASAPLVAAANAGMKFERQMSRVRAVVNPTMEDFQRLREVAKQLGASTEKTATEVGAAMQQLGQAGFDTSQIVASVADVIDMSTLTGADMATSTEILTNTLRMFNMEAERASEAASVLAKTQSATNTDVLALAEGLRYVGSTANSLGWSLQDTSAALGLLANQALKGSIGGTSLNQALVRLLKPSAEGAKLMEKYGIAIRDSSGKVREMVDVLADVEKAHLSVEQVVELFGIRGQRSIMALLNSQVKYEGQVYKGAEALRVLQEQLAKTNDYAHVQSMIIRSDTSGAFEAMWSALEGVSIALYEKFQPALRRVVNDGLVPMLRGMLVWVKDSQGLQKYLDGFFRFIDSGVQSMRDFGQAFAPAMDELFRNIGQAIPNVKDWLQPFIDWAHEVGPVLPDQLRQTGEQLATLWESAKTGIRIINDLTLGVQKVSDVLRPVGEVVRMSAEGWGTLLDNARLTLDVLGEFEGRIVDGVVKGVTEAAEALNGLSAKLADLQEWFTGGANAAAAWADGAVFSIQEGIKQRLPESLRGYADYLMGHSPPKKGPLRNIDRWGVNVGRSWTEGFADGIRGGLQQSIVTALSGGNVSRVWTGLASSAKRSFFSDIASGLVGGLFGGLGGGGRRRRNANAAAPVNPWAFSLLPMPVPAFATGGVVTSPTLALIGERGPEAVVPLSGGGPAAVGGNVVVNIIDQRSNAPAAEVQETTGPDGTRQIHVLIRDAVNKGLVDGSFDNAMSAAYGLNRKGLRR